MLKHLKQSFQINSDPEAVSNEKLSSFLLLCGCAFFLTIAVLMTGCSGTNIHRELTDDPQVLVRQWVRSTQPQLSGTTKFPVLEAGDRGSEFSNPVLVGNTLIFGTRHVGLIAIYPLQNLTRWTLPIQGGVVSEIEVADNTAYFGGGDGFLYSVNLENGRINWKYDMRNPNLSKPTYAQRRLFVTTTDDAVYAFDAGTGKWLWHYRRRSAPSASINLASQPLVDSGEVLAGLSDGYLVSLSIEEGTLKWEKRLHPGGKFTDVDAHPVLDRGTIYIPSYDGALYALKRKGGEVLWRFDAGGAKQISIEGETLYLSSSDGTLYALNKANARILWKFDLDRGTPTQAVITDRFVVFGSSYQFLYALKKDDGKAVYRYNVGMDSGFASAGAYDEKTRRLYQLSHGGNLYSFLVRKEPRKIFSHGQAESYDFGASHVRFGAPGF